MWVRSEYAGELSVLSTWLCALLPWSVSFGQFQEASVFFFWFLPGNFVFAPGIEGELERPFWAWDFPGFVTQDWETTMVWLWLAGLAVFLCALAVSLLYYFDEEGVESWRIDPVRVLGGLLLGSGVILGGAFLLLFQNQPGTSLPVGTLFLLVFGVVLLQTERVEATESEASGAK
ncbi:MAG: TIGR04206 family protein [Halovenus sp.]